MDKSLLRYLTSWLVSGYHSCGSNRSSMTMSQTHGDGLRRNLDQWSLFKAISGHKITYAFFNFVQNKIERCVRSHWGQPVKTHWLIDVHFDHLRLLPDLRSRDLRSTEANLTLTFRSPKIYVSMPLDDRNTIAFELLPWHYLFKAYSIKSCGYLSSLT